MTDYEILHALGEHGIRPTANRIQIVRALAAAGRPVSMTELETALETIDKSGVFRTLSLFREHHLVHGIEDGTGLRYELCHSHDEGHDTDLHAHFYCEACGRTFCLEDIPVPQMTLPRGYEASTVNYLIKGRCPACSQRKL